MLFPKNILAQSVIDLCYKKGLKNVVISPGSSNAPLTLGFINNNFFKTYSIVDERSAAFFALGISQQTKLPTILVCTSGSALLNYYPAISEAYFSNIPLIVLSADRPSKFLNIGDGQTINQKNVFRNNIGYSTRPKNVNYAKNYWCIIITFSTFKLIALFYQTKSPYDFILKPNKYIFSVPKLDFIGDNLVYIIKSSPKGNSKYEATLYIDSEDYAIIRLDFKNVKPIVKFKLLGVSFNYFLKEGKILMSKFKNKNYSLSYIKINGSQNYSIERPIKLIEKNKIVKGRNKQNQISFKLDMKIEQKNQIEIQVFNSSFISDEYFKQIEEQNEILPEFVELFESNFWEGF